MKTPKYQLADGYFKSGSFDNRARCVYVDASTDTIFVYSASSQVIDTVTGKHAFAPILSKSDAKTAYLRQASFDLDFLTMPFKYRPRQGPCHSNLTPI